VLFQYGEFGYEPEASATDGDAIPSLTLPARKIATENWSLTMR
jgi:hypothetical protein